MNGGVCYDTYGSFVCECPPNYSGFICEQLLDPCASQPCRHSGTCIAQKDNYYCICSQGYSGNMCENYSICQKECSNGTECIDGQCCEPDYTGRQCKYVQSGDCGCLNGGLCNRNSSMCLCPEGFDGPICENDINECEKTPKICGHGICVNQPGSFKCYCEPGMSFLRSF